MNKKILGFIVAVCMLFSVVYAYPASFIVEGLSTEVYGGAAYVITVGANNPSSEELKIALLDEETSYRGLSLPHNLHTSLISATTQL